MCTNNHESNEMVKSVNDLYYATYRPNVEEIEYKRKWFLFFKKKHKIFVNKKKLSCMFKCFEIGEALKNVKEWNFDIFRDFGTFVKITEKVFGYKNDDTAILVCDSKLSDKSRTLVFKFYGGTIVIRLYYKNENEIIDISMSKETGRKMCYGYHIIDGTVTGDLNNSDEVSLDTILDFSTTMMSSFYYYICNAIITRNVSAVFMDKLTFESDDLDANIIIDFKHENLDDVDIAYITVNKYLLNDDADTYHKSIKSLGDFEDAI